MSRAAALLTIVLASGCGDDQAAVIADAGPADAAAADGGIGVAAPAPPAFGPCASGWRELTTDTGLLACEPWPEGGPVACADDELQAPGDATCVPVGSSCPADGLPEGLPTDRPVFFVLDGAVAGGDGSRARPYARIADGLRAATSAGGAIVAVGRGRYDGVIDLPASTTIWGACPAETVLTGSAVGAYAVVATSRGATGVRNLTIADSTLRGVIANGSRATVDIEGVVVRRVAESGIDVFAGARVTARDVRIEDVAAASDGTFGFGVYAEGGMVELSRTVIARARTDGLAITLGSTARLTDVVVRDTLSEAASRNEGRGIGVGPDSTLDATRVVLEGNREAAVYVARGAAMFEQLVVRDTRQSDHYADTGYALEVVMGATLAVRGLLAERNLDAAVLADGPATTVMLEDALVRDMGESTGDPRGGTGLSAQRGATLTARRAVVERSLGLGVFADDADTTVVLEDLVVRDVATWAGNYAHGIVVERGASATITRARVERTRGFGVFVVTNASVTLGDFAVSDVRPRECGATTCAGEDDGTAVGVFDGSSARVDRFAVDGAALCGVHLALSASVDLANGTVAHCGIGACVQVDGYDVARLSNQVSYSDNGRSLDTTMLPVPSAIPPRL